MGGTMRFKEFLHDQATSIVCVSPLPVVDMTMTLLLAACPRSVADFQVWSAL
jgi:hypothetical protein